MKFIYWLLFVCWRWSSTKNIKIILKSEHTEDHSRLRNLFVLFYFGKYIIRKINLKHIIEIIYMISLIKHPTKHIQFILNIYRVMCVSYFRLITNYLYLFTFIFYNVKFAKLYNFNIYVFTVSSINVNAIIIYVGCMKSNWVYYFPNYFRFLSFKINFINIFIVFSSSTPNNVYVIPDVISRMCVSWKWYLITFTLNFFFFSFICF